MRKILAFFSILFLLGACDLWEEYNIDFINLENDEVTKYEISLKDSVEILSYKKYINDVLDESTVFFKDTSKTERITYNADGEIILKRLYKFGLDTLVVETVDSIFRNDSIIVTIKEYDYNKQFLSRVNEYSYGVNIEYNSDLIYSFSYGGNNKVERDVKKNNKFCTDVLIYTELPNKIELNNFVESGHFSNEWLGQMNKNIVDIVYWKSTCFVSENQAKPQSKYTYELDENGYVIMQREQFTPGYNTARDNNIERTFSTTYYEYIFN